MFFLDDATECLDKSGGYTPPLQMAIRLRTHRDSLTRLHAGRSGNGAREKLGVKWCLTPNFSHAPELQGAKNNAKYAVALYPCQKAF
jgi:hypothetical protein